MAERLSGIEQRSNALAKLQPALPVMESKAMKKLSLAFKAAIKNKASCKSKPSAKLKSLKKKAEKQASAEAYSQDWVQAGPF